MEGEEGPSDEIGLFSLEVTGKIMIQGRDRTLVYYVVRKE
jgi:hypothetical protein